MNVDLRDIYHQIVDRQVLAQAGSTSLFIIKKRTQEGNFLKGSTPGSGSYSEKPFALPAGAVSSRAYQQLDGTEEGNNFITRAGEIWFVITGGYKRLRQLEGLSSDKVNLQRTPGASMLDSLQVVKIEPNEQVVEVGFTDSESEQKAIWHQIMGAGKSKVKRVFVGHNAKEEQQISKSAQAQIFQNITNWNNAGA